MEELRPLTNQDRILILSPHPDDESLATGGLIQVALEAGAQVRVIYASNGDNNPWPQRFMERRLSISHRERLRWGKLRQGEAIEALAHLGLKWRMNATFLGFPDQGFNSAVLNLDDEPLTALKGEIESFRPTLLVAPSLHDRHPDHNSLAVFVSLALQQVRRPIERLVYLVHTNGNTPLFARIALNLTPAQQQRKYEAISKHTSQIMLSRRRLLRHAGPVEMFYRPVQPEADHAHHPLVSAHLADGHIHLWIPASLSPRLPSKLFIAMESLMDGGRRWSLSLPRRSGSVVLYDTISGVAVGEASAEVTECGLNFRIPVFRLEPLNQLFIKLKTPTLFFERTGWREVSVAPMPWKQASVSTVRPQRVPKAETIPKNSLAWTAFSLLALVWLGIVLSENISRPWVNLNDFNGAVWSQAAHNILRAGLVQTEGASSGFYFGPLPIPPRGYYLHHPPLLHLILTWMFGLLGEHEWVARLLPIVCSIASGILLWWLVRSCAGRRTAAFTLGILVCLPMELRYGNMVNFEPLVLMLILGALYGLRQWQLSSNGWWKALAVGLMMAGMWVDWAMYLFVIVTCAYWLAKPRLNMRRTAMLLLASALMFGGLYLLRIQMLRPDAWQNLTNAFFRRIGSNSGIHFTEAEWLRKIARTLAIHFLPPGLALALAGSLMIHRKKATHADLAWLGWACSMVTVMDIIFLAAFQNDSFIHEYIGFYLIVPVAIMSGVALNEATVWMQSRLALWAPWKPAAVCLPCLLLLVSGYWGMNQTVSMRKQFIILDYKTPEPTDLVPQLGETIRENFPPNTFIICNFMPDYGPQLGYYAQRPLLNNVSEYRFWRPYLNSSSQQNFGGVVWMNSAKAGEIIAKLPPGTKRYVKFGNLSFCLWKPSVPLRQAVSGKLGGFG